MALYARQRDDKEMERWVKEIHLRACIRIGELSRELETAQGAGGGGAPGARSTSSARPEEVPTKTAALAEAGISTSTAHEYEQLTRGHAEPDAPPDRVEQAENAAKAGAEAYFAKARDTGEVPTMRDLRAEPGRSGCG
jgi:hypothetical protein